MNTIGTGRLTMPAIAKCGLGPGRILGSNRRSPRGNDGML